MALSASAPPAVMKDIESSLYMKSPVHISHSLDRPNIFLSYSKSKGLAVSLQYVYSKCCINCIVLKRDLDGLTSVLKKASMPLEVPKTIIFCRTKNDAAKVYALLNKCAHGRHTVDMYHSSIRQETKRRVQCRFKDGSQLRCLSATIAFGMVNN